MRFFGATLAVDIRYHSERKCKGGYLVCSYIPNNVRIFSHALLSQLYLTTFQMCCITYDGTTAASLNYVNLPYAGVAVIGYDPLSGYACGFEVISGYNAGGGDACMNPPKGTTAMSGGAWAFSDRLAKTGGANRKCTGSRVVDAVVLTDGKKFKVEGMEEAMVKELYAIAWNGTAKEHVPESYASFAVTN
jgi:hypothetical protein